MLELYAFISLLGLGYLLSKKTTIPQNANMRINQNEMPSQNNIYDSNYQDAVNRLEAIKAQQSFRKSENPNTNRVINRQYRDQRDDASEKKTFKSALSGMEIPQSDFVHNNMTPFFGSRVKQNVEPVANRSVLEKFTGEFTPDIYRKKREQKPLFDPMQKDVGRDTWGSKNTNDYFQDRIVEPNFFRCSFDKVFPLWPADIFAFVSSVSFLPFPATDIFSFASAECLTPFPPCPPSVRL